jgi:hypothetical protein
VFPFPFPKKNMLTTTFISSFDRKEKRMFIKIRVLLFLMKDFYKKEKRA